MKTVLITGASRGIGKALAEKFLSEGYFVIATSTSGEAEMKNENLIFFSLDLSKSDSIKNCAENISSLGKKIDILINNAGIMVDEFSRGAEMNLLRKTMEVNLFGTVDFTERIIPILNEGAHILNASSSAGSLARSQENDDDFYPAYRISKTALNMYTRTLAVLLKGKTTVSSFHPGWVKTDMGGQDAPMLPEEAAKYIFDLANSSVETGQFWYKGEKFAW